jgi:SAM-dependent methyltransferase
MSALTSLSLEQLHRIAQTTLDHYTAHADTFWEATREHDVNQNIASLLQNIEGSAPFCILDFGCGPGRDLKSLTALGHRAVGVEGAATFVEMARQHSGCEVWHQDFMKLMLPSAYFDGVYANASLFHVPTQELPRVLSELRATLKPRGVLFSSNPHGNDDEGWHRGRYGTFHRPETWRRFLTAAGFVELNHFYRPIGLPREEQPWLATVWRHHPIAGEASA